MVNPFRDLQLSVKISLLGAGSVVLTVVALLALAVWQSGQYHQLAQTEVGALIDADLDHIAQGVVDLVRTENEAAQQQVNYNLNVARHVLANTGGANLAPETVTWTARNQFNDERTEVRLPKMLVGGQWLGRNDDPATESAIVDEVEKLVGDSATIFQRMNEQGDMLRVATTVKDAEGRRAIGSYIPARTPDGPPNPVISAVLEGGSYRGRAFVVNAWYLTAYEPLRDKAGQLVGMLYVGVRQESVGARVRQAILQTKVGKTGYVYVLGASGAERGRYIISKGGERDGEDIWKSKDASGRYFIQAIVEKALALKPGEMATERYPWQNIGESSPRWKVARLAYYAPWDWIICTSVYEDELQRYRAVLSGGRWRMTNSMVLAGLTIALLIGLLSILVARTIARPIRLVTKAAETIIRGNHSRAVEVCSQDEIGTLARTFNYMTETLRLDVERMETLLQLSQMAGATLEELMGFTFEEAVRLTRSRIGYLGFVGEDEAILDVRVWSREVMPECKVTASPFQFVVAGGGLWGEAIRQRRPIITNDYAAPNLWKKGTPAGHVRLTRHMNLPVIVGGKVVLVAGVGNKDEDYNEADVNHLTLLMEGMWRLIERKRAEEEMARLNASLEERVKDRTAELERKNFELERLNRLFVGRELQMVQLKARMAALKRGLSGTPAPDGE